ncbi:hypothetical protein BISA_1894 [Bifidobacterium saguini DSM 23967]|uniref:Uncharacterized protein n=1 Tax=Bifidobacterium saguini DSM 23967 TaxID=1437607 RepID=A0A087D6Y9_9BIFI|nr:hypothetical protein [Bifidobacterium saguini]KFI91289.1 hypothetical protein BISA_1894 [Bifidobacterium saguini DSM 23967]
MKTPTRLDRIALDLIAAATRTLAKDPDLYAFELSTPGTLPQLIADIALGDILEGATGGMPDGNRPEPQTLERLITENGITIEQADAEVLRRYGAAGSEDDRYNAVLGIIVRRLLNVND